MTTSSNRSSGQKAMEQLSQSWYNSLTRNLQLNRGMFQLCHPVNPVIRSTEELWNLFDAVPPLSLTVRSPAKRFSTEYLSIAHQFSRPQNDLKESIGEDTHEKWLKYLNRIHPAPPDSKLPALFRQWAMLAAPSKMAVGVAKLSQWSILNRTFQSIDTYGGPGAKEFDFSPELPQVKDIVANSTGFSFDFDSESGDSKVDDTWTGGIVEGLAGLWSDDASNSPLSKNFARGPVRATISAKSYAVCTVVPGSWYSSSLLNSAFSNHGTPPWPSNPNPTWKDLFGPDGSFRRAILSVVLADGVKASITAGGFSEKDRSSIQENAAKGLWPLYIPDSEGAAANRITFVNDNSIKVETTTQAGSLVLLGDNVMEISQYLGHGPSNSTGL